MKVISMSDKIIKFGDAKMTHHKEGSPRVKQFRKRRITGGKVSASCTALARACAEDANTAFYVREYEDGNYACREDFIEYMADKFQFLVNGGKL